MNEEESIDEIFSRFTTIINGLKYHGKDTNLEKARKLVKYLAKAWRPKVTTIEEAKTCFVLTRRGSSNTRY